MDLAFGARADHERDALHRVTRSGSICHTGPVGPRRLALLLALSGCTAPVVDGQPPSTQESGDPSDGPGGTTPAPTSGGDDDDDDGPSQDSSGGPSDAIDWLCPTDPDAVPHFELGWDYKDGWIDLDPGGPVTITIGGQGAWMIPLGVRGDGFCVPADPHEYDYVPPLDLTISAEEHAEPISMVTEFPVSFEPIEVGGLGYTFIPMMIHDSIDIMALDGQHTVIEAELSTRDGVALSFTLEGTLTISD